MKSEGCLYKDASMIVSSPLLGALPRDVILAAAMLSVVLSNILVSGSGEPLVAYTELVSSWFCRQPDLKPFSKLALCHAFLAKLPAPVLVGVALEGQALLLALFPVVCRLFDG